MRYVFQGTRVAGAVMALTVLAAAIAISGWARSAERESIFSEPKLTATEQARVNFDAAAAKTADPMNKTIDAGCLADADELAAALKTVMDVGNLDEANRIKAGTETVNVGAINADQPTHPAAIAALRKYERAVIVARDDRQFSKYLKTTPRGAARIDWCEPSTYRLKYCNRLGILCPPWQRSVPFIEKTTF